MASPPTLVQPHDAFANSVSGRFPAAFIARSDIVASWLPSHRNLLGPSGSYVDPTSRRAEIELRAINCPNWNAAIQESADWIVRRSTRSGPVCP
jgi:hypothetical protein